MKPTAVLLLTAAALAAQTQYDLLLTGGHVIDAKNHLSAIRDVAIQDHKIAKVAANIPRSAAFKVIDVKGLYVTPGLVDMHVHVYAGTGAKGAYSGDLSLYPDGYTFRNGVTTVADAGSSGWRNFPDFKDRVIDRAKTRILAFLNIVGSGMGGGKIEQNVEVLSANERNGHPGVGQLAGELLVRTRDDFGSSGIKPCIQMRNMRCRKCRPKVLQHG